MIGSTASCGGLLKPIDWTDGMLPPMRDFNEDIPACNEWWYGAPPYVLEFILPFAYRQGTGNYQRDPLFWIRAMLCSLGMRGQRHLQPVEKCLVAVVFQCGRGSPRPRQAYTRTRNGLSPHGVRLPH
jgi:hypothetical protein